MGIGPFGNSTSFYEEKCCHERQISQLRDEVTNLKAKMLKNPNPANFERIKLETFRHYFIAEIRYPNCNKYNGHKLMVFSIKMTNLNPKRYLTYYKNNQRFFCSGDSRRKYTYQGDDKLQPFTLKELHLECQSWVFGRHYFKQKKDLADLHLLELTKAQYLDILLGESGIEITGQKIKDKKFPWNIIKLVKYSSICTNKQVFRNDDKYK